MTDPNSPLDSALDLLVFVPVGIAVTAAEELPKLAAKGRSRVEQQVAVARVVGQFAVAKGRGELRRRITRGVDNAGAPTTEHEAATTVDETIPRTAAADGGDSSAIDPSDLQAAGSASDVGEAGKVVGTAGTTSGEFSPQSGAGGEADVDADPPAATGLGASGVEVSGVEAPPSESLAIPGYDSLSASQVVQRLAGLSDDELAAVSAYESAHRARQTVLTRVSQLQLGRD